MTFPVRRIQSVRGAIRVELAGKEYVPAYGELGVVVGGQRMASPVGALGEFDFENLPAGDHGATVEFREGTCSFTLHVPASDKIFVDLGVVRCAAPILQKERT